MYMKVVLIKLFLTWWVMLMKLRIFHFNSKLEVFISKDTIQKISFLSCTKNIINGMHKVTKNEVAFKWRVNAHHSNFTTFVFLGLKHNSFIFYKKAHRDMIHRTKNHFGCLHVVEWTSFFSWCSIYFSNIFF